jgi:tetraacyldisaccharide 4'-kinase
LIRGRLETLVRRLWFDPLPGLALWLPGLALRSLCPVTRRLAGRNRAAIRALPAPAVPVLIVGNLVAGGSGKTPLVAALVAELSQRGWSPGVITGAWRAREQGARIVSPTDGVSQATDEALLLARACGRPVAAGRRRSEALERLLRSHPDIDLVISDDGLQHPALPRSLELVVFDSRGAGNGLLLPAGPLREPLERLQEFDAIVVNGDPGLPLPGIGAVPASLPVFGYRIEPRRLRRVDGSGETLSIDEMVARAAGRPVAAIAGIGDPERFFRTLTKLGLTVGRKLLPGDHRALEPAALAALSEALIVMTTKDAVKYSWFADERCWALETDAVVGPGLADWLDIELRKVPNGRSPA